MFPFGGMLNHDNSQHLDLPGSISIFDFDIWNSNPGLGIAIAGIDLNNAGALREYDSNGTKTLHGQHWMAAAGRIPSVGDLYECRLSVSGSPDTLNAGSSALATWLTLDGLRSWWYWTDGPYEFLSGNFTLEVREIAYPANIVSCSVHLNADVEV